jgi:hypothetical protein
MPGLPEEGPRSRAGGSAWPPHGREGRMTPAPGPWNGPGASRAKRRCDGGTEGSRPGHGRPLNSRGSASVIRTPASFLRVVHATTAAAAMHRRRCGGMLPLRAVGHSGRPDLVSWSGACRQGARGAVRRPCRAPLPSSALPRGAHAPGPRTCRPATPGGARSGRASLVAAQPSCRHRRFPGILTSRTPPLGLRECDSLGGAGKGRCGGGAVAWVLGAGPRGEG